MLAWMSPVFDNSEQADSPGPWPPPPLAEEPVEDEEFGVKWPPPPPTALLGGEWPANLIWGKSPAESLFLFSSTPRLQEEAGEKPQRQSSGRSSSGVEEEVPFGAELRHRQ
jgi:hypothetical protein